MSISNILQHNNRADLSQFLIHLTKDGTYEEFTYVSGPNIPGFDVINRTVIAKISLEEILQNNRIEARGPFGYFKLKINRYRAKFNKVFDNGGFQPNEIKAVCFSETPLSELSSFYNAVKAKRNKYKKYGLGFWQDKIRDKGCNPVFYVDSRKQQLIDALNSIHLQATPQQVSLMPLIDTFGPPVIPGAAIFSDFRWEREWRKKDSLDFANEDVAFGICSDSEVQYFQNLVNNVFPFIDPDWDTNTLKTHLTKFGATALLSAL